MLLYVPSLVVNAILVILAIYAMWTRGLDLSRAQSHPKPTPGVRPEALAA